MWHEPSERDVDGLGPGAWHHTYSNAYAIAEATTNTRTYGGWVAGNPTARLRRFDFLTLRCVTNATNAPNPADAMSLCLNSTNISLAIWLVQSFSVIAVD
jgi:hypothetical protein